MLEYKILYTKINYYYMCIEKICANQQFEISKQSFELIRNIYKKIKTYYRRYLEIYKQVFIADIHRVILRTFMEVKYDIYIPYKIKFKEKNNIDPIIITPNDYKEVINCWDYIK